MFTAVVLAVFFPLVRLRFRPTGRPAPGDATPGTVESYPAPRSRQYPQTVVLETYHGDGEKNLVT